MPFTFALRNISDNVMRERAFAFGGERVRRWKQRLLSQREMLLKNNVESVSAQETRRFAVYVLSRARDRIMCHVFTEHEENSRNRWNNL